MDPLEDQISQAVAKERHRFYSIIDFQVRKLMHRMSKKVIPANELKVAEFRLKLAKAIYAELRELVQRGFDPNAKEKTE